MALFKRMKALAQERAETGKLKMFAENDEEGRIALCWLQRIWSEITDDANKQRGWFTKKVPAEEAKSKVKLTEVIRQIELDKLLVFANWTPGHDEVSYVKQFPSHALEERAQELLSMIDFADGNITNNMGPMSEGEKLADLIPPVDDEVQKGNEELARRFKKSAKYAKRLVVPADWLTEFAEAEGTYVGTARQR